MEENKKMNPDWPRQRGCWLELKGEDKKAPDSVVLRDYPTWREKNGPELPAWNKNAPVRDGSQWEREFKTLAEAETFMKDENYVRCDIPSALKPKKPGVQPQASKVDFLASF